MPGKPRHGRKHLRVVQRFSFAEDANMEPSLAHDPLVLHATRTKRVFLVVLRENPQNQVHDLSLITGINGIDISLTDSAVPYNIETLSRDAHVAFQRPTTDAYQHVNANFHRSGLKKMFLTVVW